MIMGWTLALLTALLESSKDVFFSRQALKAYSGLLKAWLLVLCSVPVLALVLVYRGMPQMIQPRFWTYLIIQVVLLSTAQVLYMRALALGPLSRTQPILGLTTILLAVTNPLMTHERVSAWGWVGVITVGVGIYATQHPGIRADGKPAGFFSPFGEMWRQPGVMSKIGVAVIYSITANMDRLGIEASSGPFYSTMMFCGMTLVLGTVLGLSLVLRKRAVGIEARPAFTPWLFAGGALNAGAVLMHVTALGFLPVPFVIALKRTSILMTSLWGYIVRRERMSRYHLLGTVMVVAGIVIVLLLGKHS